jgi:hypothetical protein
MGKMALIRRLPARLDKGGSAFVFPLAFAIGAVVEIRVLI